MMLKSRLAWLLIGVLALALPLWTSPSAAQDDDVDPVEFRFAHLVPDAPNVDVYADGVLIAEDVAFGTVTDWAIIAEGRYDLAVTVTGDDVDDAVFVAENVDLSANANIRVTVVAYGSVERGTLSAAVTREDFNATNSARLELFHALERGPAVDMISADLLLVGGLGYPGTQGNNDGHLSLELPAREYADVRLEADNTDITLLDAGDLTLEAGTSYFIAAVGPYTQPSLVVLESEIGTPEPVATPEESDADDEPAATATPIANDDAANDDAANDDTSDVDTTTDNDAEPAAAATPLVTGIEFANVRVGHFASDAPDVDIYLNGFRVEEGLAFGTMTDWIINPGNVVEVAVVPTGDVLENAVLVIVEGLPITEETQRGTLAIIGSVEAGTLSVQPFIEAYTPVATGEARIEVFHALEGGPPIDVLLSNVAIVSDVFYPGTVGDNDGAVGRIVVASSGFTDLNVADGSTGELLAFLEGVAFPEQTSTLVVVTATATETVIFQFETAIPN